MEHDVMATTTEDGGSRRATVTEQTIAGFPAFVGTPAPGASGRAPVVLLHGAFADHHAFPNWLQRFAEDGHIAYAPARRGRVGIGPDRAEGLDVEDYLEDTRAVIAALDEAPIIVGHSLGGLLAQQLAAEGRARAIVLLASAPPAMLTAQPIALRRFGPQMPRIMAGRPFVVSDDACSVLALNKVPTDRRPAIHAHLTPESGKVYRALMMGSVRVDASKVRVPVFVAGGTDDRIISTKLVRKTARHYGVEAKIYPDHGHWLVDEPGTERIMDDVTDWLAAAVPDAPAADDVRVGAGPDRASRG